MQNHMRRLTEECKNMLGHPPVLYCCDTDSVQHDELDLRDAATKKFVDETWHNRKLGYFKLEHSLSKLAVGGKKIYAGFDEEGTLISLACKGIPEKLVDGHHILQLCEYDIDEFVQRYEIPHSLRHDLVNGITEVRDATRSIRRRNHTRKNLPGQDISVPWATLGEFVDYCLHVVC